MENRMEPQFPDPNILVAIYSSWARQYLVVPPEGGLVTATGGSAQDPAAALLWDSYTNCIASAAQPGIYLGYATGSPLLKADYFDSPTRFEAGAYGSNEQPNGMVVTIGLATGEFQGCVWQYSGYASGAITLSDPVPKPPYPDPHLFVLVYL
jgi:hypothetical protein